MATMFLKNIPIHMNIFLSTATLPVYIAISTAGVLSSNFILLY